MKYYRVQCYRPSIGSSKTNSNGKYREVKSRLFDYKNKTGKENKPTFTKTKPTTSVTQKQKDAEIKTNSKAGMKRKSSETLKQTAKRRHSEAPSKHIQHKPVSGILKRKSCIGSFDFTDEASKKQENKPVLDNKKEEQKVSSNRRLSYTICEAVSTTADDDSAPKICTAAVTMATPGTSSRNVRFCTPLNSSLQNGEQKKLRKTPKTTLDRR